MTNGDWQRVSRRRPCPICEKADWCLYAGPADSPAAVICTRVKNSKRVGREGGGGWLHRLHDDRVWCRQPRIVVQALKPSTISGDDLARLAAKYTAAGDSKLDQLASDLRVSPESLRHLSCGWSNDHRAWSFPMTDSDGTTHGIRLRRPNGFKFAVKGGHNGLFIPRGLIAGDVLLVCEGASDTAALFDLGFQVVGRPNCSGGVKLLADLVRRLSSKQVVIVADADDAGRRGAESLAAVLLAYTAAVSVIVPPNEMKDARAWKAAGACRADVQAVIDAAPVRKLKVASRMKGR